MPLEVELHTLLKPVIAEQITVAPNYFASLHIYGRSVEIIHADVRLWTNRMGHGTGIFCELSGA